MATQRTLLRALSQRGATASFRPSTLPRITTRLSSTLPTYEHLTLTTPAPKVAQITLNRPKALNALCTPLINDLNSALTSLRADTSIHAVVLTGSPRAFAAGADIKEMAPLTFATAYGEDFITSWSNITAFPKPIIAAVNGYALGGGCELAMMCDIIYAGRDATFGQPEIKLGVIPGAGGSQRLTRAVGKSRAMEIILTGENFSGEEAERWGLVSKTFGTAEETVAAAVKTAAKIAGYGRVAVKAAKEVVNRSQEAGLRDGVEFERRVFHGLFGTKDQKEGMEAFAGKRKAEWKHE
ncbi:Enoyl-CoA hydratase, mitochondrial [Sphaceloma murrayae]|uniref:Probable enoyl-CoA hydratase, mitochondrial n=1 Tax=Sphaceloma murrayae TaxID=2082308 RepID=A0A2K1R0E7_9PEZI|nr:Enoyl-CoA hydratase, mitochondrial [Sphaceloma murrayae]